ncbi:MAG: hypothetical protein HRT74_00030 [Flavobacteriales bacterium]|nr:hypothetical protein [Flavobacteriales bacterium]
MSETKHTHHYGASTEAIYDFSNSPLWKEYFLKTRKSAKFPRGYKEVRLR